METHATTSPAPTGRTMRPARRRKAVVGLTALAAATIATLLPATAASASTPFAPGLVTRDAAGTPGNGVSSSLALSGDGRFVAFGSSANNLVPGDTNGEGDVFVKDRLSGAIERVSVSNGEAQANETSAYPSISDDGRYVAFVSTASNLVAGDTKGNDDVFVRDRYAGTTTRVSRGLAGAEPNQHASQATISGNGRYVAYQSLASNLVANDTNAAWDVFVRDLQSSTTERVSISVFEGQANGSSERPSISDDGRYVAFRSDADLAGGQPAVGDIYVRDRTGGTTMIASVSSDEELATGKHTSPIISGNGRYVAFESNATTLVAGDANGTSDVFRRDLQAGVTTRVSLHDNDSSLNYPSFAEAISDDGNKVLFSSQSPATAAADSGFDQDAFVRNVGTASTARMSTSTASPDPSLTAYGQSLDDSGDWAAYDATGSGHVADHPAGITQGYVAGRWNLSMASGTGDFINQQYYDFAGRPATPDEVASWEAKIKSGAASPAGIAGTLAADEAWAGDRAPVVRLYWAFFLRKPDTSGITYWIGQFQAGKGLPAIAQAFAGSSEFKNTYGSLSNASFVKLVYQNVLERQPDAAGLAYWTAQLDQGKKSRGGVMVGFSESPEGQRFMTPQVHIMLISLGMFREAPSAGFWATQLALHKAGDREIARVAAAVMDTEAYAMRLD